MEWTVSTASRASVRRAAAPREERQRRAVRDTTTTTKPSASSDATTRARRHAANNPLETQSAGRALRGFVRRRCSSPYAPPRRWRAHSRRTLSRTARHHHGVVYDPCPPSSASICAIEASHLEAVALVDGALVHGRARLVLARLACGPAATARCTHRGCAATRVSLGPVRHEDDDGRWGRARGSWQRDPPSRDDGGRKPTDPRRALEVRLYDGGVIVCRVCDNDNGRPARARADDVPSPLDMAMSSA